MSLRILDKTHFFIFLIPLFDVFLYFLFCLSFTSGFVYQSGVKIEIPVSQSKILLQEKAFLLIVPFSNPLTLYLNNTSFSLESLDAFLGKISHKEAKQKQIYLKIDKNLSVEKQNEIINVLSSHGFEIFLLHSNEA